MLSIKKIRFFALVATFVFLQSCISNGSNSTTTTTTTGSGIQVTIGTGNTILTDPSNSIQNTKPFSVQVINNNGNPVSGATVTVTLEAAFYYKGRWSDDGTDWGLTYFDAGVGAFANGVWQCNAEVDTDGDGIPDVDNNGNGVTDPSLSSAIISHPSLTPTSATGTVTTNSSGHAYFALAYAKSRVPWVGLNIVAVATSGLFSDTDIEPFTLEGVESDYVSGSGVPGEAESVFGQINDCTSTL